MSPLLSISSMQILRPCSTLPRDLTRLVTGPKTDQPFLQRHASDPHQPHRAVRSRPLVVLAPIRLHAAEQSLHVRAVPGSSGHAALVLLSRRFPSCCSLAPESPSDA